MKNKVIYASLLVGLTLFACVMEEKKEPIINPNSEMLTWKKEVVPMEDSLFDQMIVAHGSNKLMNNAYRFEFRNKKYQVSHRDGKYEYQVHIKTDTSDYIDYLKDGNFSRIAADKEIKLSSKEVSKYSNSLNSVIYFSTLPDKLRDKAVNKSYLGSDSIKGQTYSMLGITFDQEGGGEDHEDEYIYWINTVTHEIDYLAYNYSVNNGGVRFRSAYNKRKVEGVVFQDYINYKAAVGTPLIELSDLYEQNRLEELSRIETKNVALIQ